MFAGGHSSLLFLFFLLYIFVPSNGLQCLLKQDFAPEHRGFTREQGKSELRAIFPDLNDKAKIKAVLDGTDETSMQLADVMTKLLVLFSDSKVYLENCKEDQKCCVEEKKWSVIKWSCSNQCGPDPDDDTDAKNIMNVCSTDRCIGDYQGTPDVIDDSGVGKEFSQKVHKLVNFCNEISPALGQAMKETYEESDNKIQKSELSSNNDGTPQNNGPKADTPPQQQIPQTNSGTTPLETTAVVTLITFILI